MGVDTKLYLNTRWGIDDIITVLERTQGASAELQSHHSFAPGYFSIEIAGRSINLHSYTEIPTGTCTMLSLRANAGAHKMFEDVANVLGGILERYDSDGNCEMIQGSLWDEDNLAYHLKYAVIHDGISPDSMTELNDSINQWKKRIHS